MWKGTIHKNKNEHVQISYFYGSSDIRDRSKLWSPGISEYDVKSVWLGLRLDSFRT